MAQTGTGKTAAYGLPILQKINISQYQPQALILCPTRELCLQIADDLNDYSKYIDNLKVLPVYGGSSIESQIKTLKRGVHVVVATPGRLIDLMNRKTVDLSNVKNVILDEADEMLNMVSPTVSTRSWRLYRKTAICCSSPLPCRKRLPLSPRNT